jgi:hypothetical protein
MKKINQFNFSLAPKIVFLKKGHFSTPTLRSKKGKIVTFKPIKLEKSIKISQKIMKISKKSLSFT